MVRLPRLGLPSLRLGESRLALDEQQRRARRIALVLTDCDGVLTDNGVFYGSDGEALKRFSIRDGMGVERLRMHGIETGIVTGEVSSSVRARAEKLRIRHLYLGIKDKRAALDRVLADTGLSIEQVAYIGDDVNDLDVLRAIGECGLTATPADGMLAVAALVHYRARARGGHGAFRDFAELLLAWSGELERGIPSRPGELERGIPSRLGEDAELVRRSE